MSSLNVQADRLLPFLEIASTAYKALIGSHEQSYLGYRALNEFVSGHQSRSRLASTTSVTVVSIGAGDSDSQGSNSPRVDFRDLGGLEDLERELIELDSFPGSSGHCRLFLVENIWPKAICLLGGYFNLDTQFFADHINTPSWFRIEDISNKTQHLPSSKTQHEHLQIRYSDPRPITNVSPTNTKAFTPNNLEFGPPAYHDNGVHHLLPNFPVGVNRGAGLFTPRSRNGQQFKQILNIRQAATAWFRGMGAGVEGWTGRSSECVPSVAI